MQIFIDRLEVGAINFPVPTGDDRVDFDAFDDIASVIQFEWDTRRKSKALKGRDAATPWLCRTAYATLGPIIASDAEHLFEERNRKHGRYSKGQPKGLNPFQVGFMALFAHKPQTIAKGVREKLSKELWSAHQLYIPPIFLEGFLTELRSERRAGSFQFNIFENKFTEWVKIHQKLSISQYTMVSDISLIINNLQK